MFYHSQCMRMRTCLKQLFKNAKVKSFGYNRKLSVNTENFEELVDDLVERDKDYLSLVERYLGVASDHSCYIIHPYVKWGPQKLRDITPQLQLEEAVALLRTLGTWRVVETTSVPLDNLAKKTIFGSGALAKLQKRIRGDPSITAVFVNMGVLKNVQIEELEKCFGVPILDRYKIVMQILRLHAVSKHAKLQVALAEIPYLRSRLRRTDSEFQVGGNFDTRRLMLQNREQKLKEAVRKLRSQRELLRNRRNKIDYPIVAVVGYTNAGKTSLIKALTLEKSLQPQDRLFATLDVTLHSGILPSNLEVLYVDTVGFISDIPTGLIECFVATLEDAVFADVILHVEDLSSESIIHQRNHVLATLQNLAQKSGTKDISDKIIRVGNKCDVAAKADDMKELLDVILHVEDLSSESIIHQRNHVLATLQNLAQKSGTKDISDKIIRVGNKCDVAAKADDMKELLDVILHVEDLSSESIIHQRNHVLATLQNLAQKSGTKDISDKIIRVGNKCDVAAKTDDMKELLVSSKTGLGIEALQQKLEQEVISRTGRLVLTIRLPTGGDEIRWLSKNAAVASAVCDPNNSQYQNVKIIITQARLHQFRSRFIQ